MLHNVYSAFIKPSIPSGISSNAGFLLGVATLINIEVSLYSCCCCCSSMNYFRPFNWRAIIWGWCSAFAAPFTLPVAFFFLIDRFNQFYLYYLSTGWLRFNKIEQAFELRFLLVAGILLFILVIALVKLSNNFMKNTIKSRKSQFVTGFMFFLDVYW